MFLGFYEIQSELFYPASASLTNAVAMKAKYVNLNKKFQSHSLQKKSE